MTPPATNSFQPRTSGTVCLGTVEIECTNGSVEYAMFLHISDSSIVATHLLTYWRHWLQKVGGHNQMVKNGYAQGKILDQGVMMDFTSGLNHDDDDSDSDRTT